MMTWQICIRYPNGQEKAICSHRSREVALKWVDAIYSQGYPMHVAYIVRPGDDAVNLTEDSASACLQFA